MKFEYSISQLNAFWRKKNLRMSRVSKCLLHIFIENENIKQISLFSNV